MGPMIMTTIENRHYFALNLQPAGIVNKLQINVFWILLATYQTAE